MVSGVDPLVATRRVVIKIGSALLVDQKTGLRQQWLFGLAEDLAQLRKQGCEALVVSSGAIALGRRILGSCDGPLPLEHAQAAASVGQIALSRAYAEALEAVGLRAGQALLTLGDTQDRRRYLNGCATLKTLLALGVIPVVNENDAVATDEIRFGDNDRLAARAAVMAGADMLVLLSDVDGFYQRDPRLNPDAEHIAVIHEIGAEVAAMASGPGTAGAKGGMATKILAAKAATQGGCAMIIAKGFPEHGDPFRAIRALRNGGRHTLFTAKSTPQKARKAWIAGLKPLGAITVDAGAARALSNGASVLAAGVKAAEGDFQRGDPVLIRDESGDDLGAGLVGYAAADIQRIAGAQSKDISAILGYEERVAVAHRDDMVLWEATRKPTMAE